MITNVIHFQSFSSFANMVLFAKLQISPVIDSNIKGKL